MSNKEYYQLYSADAPIFHQPFWLDIVAGSNWDVALVKKEGLIASMPYVMNRSTRRTRITMPPLTQFLGPYIFTEESSNYYQKLSNEHQILDELISQLPKFFYLEQRWNHKFQNWLPLYWKGFQQTTKYTYVLNSISETDKIWKAMKATARNEIKKAEQELSIYTDQDVAGMYRFIKSGLKRKEITIPYSENLLKGLYDQCANRNCGKLYWARNTQNQPVAGILVVWDKSTCYYLLGSSADNVNNYGLRLLIWNAILEAGKIVSAFDFEGSMVKGVLLIAESLALIGDIEIEWFHIGEGFYDVPSYREKINHSLLNSKNVRHHLLGNMLKSEVISFFTNHYIDLLINVSSSEGLPVSMMEAMSARIPVMGTEVGGVAEIVKDGYNGFLLPSNPDAGFIATSLRKFYLLPETEKEKFRQHAFNTWEVNFNAAINYPAFINEFLSL